MSSSPYLRGLAASALSLCALGLAIPAHSVETPVTKDTNEDTDKESIAEMLVPGSRLPSDFSLIPASVTVIDAKRIAVSPAQTVTDLLALEAGISVRSLFGNRAARTTVDLRGFGITGGQNTLILLDGRRLNDVDSATVNFAALPLQAIERIEITRGSGSTLYGDGASGGTINIVTRRTSQGPASGLFGASGGSYHSRELNGRLGFTTGELTLGLSGDSLRSDGQRDNNEMQQENGQLELRIVSGGLELFAKAGASDQKLGLPGVRRVNPAISENQLRDDRDGTNTPNDYADEQQCHATLGFVRELGPRAGLLMDVGYRKRDQQAFYDDYDFGGAYASYLDTGLVTRSFTPRLYIDHALFGPDGPGGRLTAGVDYYSHDYDSDRALNPQSRATPAHRLSVDRRSTSFYLNDISRPTERLTTHLGVRLEHVKLLARDVLDMNAPGGAFDSAAPDFVQRHSETLTEAGLRYALNEQWQVFARGGRSVRFATVDDLFQYGPTFMREFSPIQPQVGKHLDLGASYRSGTVDGSLTLYGMNLTNEIHYNPVTFANENLDPTRRSGVEAQIGVQALPTLSLRLNATLLRSQFRAGAFDGNEVPVAPKRLANLSAFWSPATNMTLAAALRHVGPKRFDNDETNTFNQRIPAYSQLDTRLTGAFRQWNWSLGVNNVLNKQAFDYGVASTSAPGRYNAYPLPGRNVVVGMQRSFD